MDTASNNSEHATAGWRLPLDRRSAGPASTADAECARGQLLRSNAEWFCRLRWGVVCLLATAGLAGLVPERFVRFGLRPEWSWAWGAAAALAAANVVYRYWLSRTAPTASAGRRHLWAQIVVDLLVLTAVVHSVGSLNTHAPFAYLFHVVLACIFFSARASFLVTALAAAFYLGCLGLEASGVWPATSVLLPASAEPALRVPLGGSLLSIVSAIGIWFVIWYLVSRLAAQLRLREEQLAATNQRLKASSEERMRHMLQTTHQLKAPFAAIHAQTQLLLDGYCGPLGEGAVAVVRKIAARCQMLSRQIQDMLQLANLRSEAQSPARPQEIDLRALVQATGDRIASAAAARGITLTAEIEPIAVLGTEDHLVMLLDNLLTNAVNYSYDHSPVEVSLRRTPEGSAVLKVRDHGIGIPADKLPLVCDDYFRTKEAVRHNPSSTGLGLAIVRDVARLSGFQLDIRSSPGWGTEVTVTIRAAPVSDKVRHVSEGVLSCPTS